MTGRKNIGAADIPGHKNPIPAATVVGNVLFSSAVIGKDPETGELPEGKEAQIANVFQIIRAIMREAGGTTDDIGKLSVYLANSDDRKLVNSHWLEMFPDENNRPARHTTIQVLPAGQHLQVEFIAVL